MILYTILKKKRKKNVCDFKNLYGVMDGVLLQ